MMVSLDKTLFLSWECAEPFKALHSSLKLHWFGLQHVGCAWSPYCGEKSWNAFLKKKKIIFHWRKKDMNISD